VQAIAEVKRSSRTATRADCIHRAISEDWDELDRLSPLLYFISCIKSRRSNLKQITEFPSFDKIEKYSKILTLSLMHAKSLLQKNIIGN